MNRYMIFAAATILTLAFAGALYAIDADEIVRRHLEAKGGIERFKALKTLFMKGKLSTGDMIAELEVAKRAPCFYSFHIRTSRGTTAEGWDGKNMWSINPRTGFRKIEGEEYYKQLDRIVMEPLLGYKERGGRYEYLGTKDVRGDSCYELLYIDKAGDSVYSVFFDVDTYYMLKLEAPAPNGVAEQFFEDFKDVDGFVFPSTVKIGSSADKRTITYDEITVNKPLPDSLFVMPDPQSVPSIAKPLPDSLQGVKPKRQ